MGACLVNSPHHSLPATPARAQSANVASQTARALVQLRESLMKGEFAPGERMSELPLVARLGVSRTPIRLALERLAHMGLLDVSVSGGFTVHPFRIRMYQLTLPPP